MEEELISKFSNIYIMLLYAIMSNDINKVKHFLSPDLIKYYENIINNNIKNKEIEMFDELNVKEIEILEQKELDNYIEVKVRLISRYMDYIIDSETKKYKRGINNHRIEKENILIFQKENNALEKEMYTCPKCGANLDVNFRGTCPYCNSVVSMNEHDYLLVSIETK